MTDYRRLVCSALLEVYERRDVYRTGVFANRIKIDVLKDRAFAACYDYQSQMDSFHDAVFSLEREGVVGFAWLEGKPDTKIELIWLEPSAEAVRALYRILGRVPTRSKALEFAAEARQAAGRMAGDLGAFLAAQADRAAETLRIPRFFSKDDAALNSDVIRALEAIDANTGEVMERVLSARLYKDSKRFERDVKAKVLSILKAAREDPDPDGPDGERLLEERGVVRYPEVFGFRGRIRALFDDGSQVDYGPLVDGAYINSASVRRLAGIEGPEIRKVVFIENLASYTEEVAATRAPDVLVVYHGGFYSPMRGAFFRAIYEGLRGRAAFFHRSDIDLGGFRLFVRLRDSIIPTLAPERMDEGTFLAHLDGARPLGGPRYREALRLLLDDPAYEVFRPVVSAMLERGLKLEQEALSAGPAGRA